MEGGNLPHLGGSTTPRYGGGPRGPLAPLQHVALARGSLGGDGGEGKATHTPLSAYGKANAQAVAPGFPAQATRLQLAKLPSTEKPDGPQTARGHGQHAGAARLTSRDSHSRGGSLTARPASKGHQAWQAQGRAPGGSAAAASAEAPRDSKAKVDMSLPLTPSKV